MLTYEKITKSEAIKTYIIRADESLGALGFTEHSFAHVMHVAETAGYILETMGYDERTVELAKIAGYLHDIGNLVNRKDHSQSGAVMAWSILNDMGCDPGEMATIVTAIGNHDEGTGVPVNAVAAATHPRQMVCTGSGCGNLLRAGALLHHRSLYRYQGNCCESSDDGPAKNCRMVPAFGRCNFPGQRNGIGRPGQDKKGRNPG